MGNFWIEKAHQYIKEHRSYSHVSEIKQSDANNNFVIGADLSVGLPAAFIAEGVTDIGVRSIEPVSFVFSKDFPLDAPKIVLRDDFPRGFPHINPSIKEVLPCIYEGDLSELLQQSEWLNGILNQLVDWMEKAAAGSLMNYSQGWEPMRNDHPSGFIIYDVFETLDFVKDSEIGSRAIDYEERNGKIFTDSLCDSNNKKKSTLFISRSKDFRVINKYCPNSILNLNDLYSYAQEIGIPGLKQHVENYDSKHLNEDKLFIILAIKRPVNLIGASSPVELLNFVVHKSKHRKGKKRVLPECKVGMLIHINDTSPKLLQKITGSKQRQDYTNSIAILGCGSLGSKIALHLARNGNTPFSCIDSDIFLPHNNARHGLSLAWTSNKARLLSYAIRSISGKAARIFDRSVKFLDLSDNRFIIDTTASLSVRSYLMNETKFPPIISCMLYGSGSLGVTLIEGNKKITRLDDLWAFLYHYSIECEWFRKIIYSEQKNPILIGQSCSSQTIILSDATLSLYSAHMALRIQGIIEDDFPDAGEIILSRISDEYNLLSEKLEVPKSLEVKSITKRDWTVRIFDAVVGKMKEQSLSSKENETGGCLIGSVFLASRSIIITDIIPPPPDSCSSPTLFLLGTEGLEKIIKDIEYKSNAKVTYLGTWHSHPYGGPASDRDNKTAQKLLFVRNYEPTVCLIWTPSMIFQI